MSTTNWDAWQFFLGEWIGEGAGGPGKGSGGFTFSFDLGGQILVRRNYAEYPPTNDQPAYRHNDLMIIYQEPEKPWRAIYFDNEGHIINYTVDISTDQNMVTFISDTLPTVPRFRFIYEKMDSNSVAITFDIAQPGKSDDFATYITASAHRKS